MTLHPIEMFVSLYYVWAVFGAITAFMYGRLAYKQWRAAGRTWGSVTNEIGALSLGTLGRYARDWLNMVRYFVSGLTGFTFRRGKGGWPSINEFMDEPVEVSDYPRNQRLLLGIALGGTSRFITAMYWAELNRGWMTETNVWLPAFPIFMAILADTNHHMTAFSKRPWIARLLFSAAMVYVALGLMVGI